MAMTERGSEDENIVPLKTKKQHGAGVDGVRDMLGSARRENARARRGPRDPDIGKPLVTAAGEIPPGQWIPDRNGLAPGCPVGVLGKEGGILHLTDSMGQLRSMPAEKLSQKTVQELVGNRQLWLYWAFPRYNKDKQVVAWRNELFVEMIAAAAHRRGLWSPVDRVRGLGMWCDPAGRLLFHAGDAVFRENKLDDRFTPDDPGELDGAFYPARPALPAPFSQIVTAKTNPAIDLFRNLQTWNWERPFIDPFLLMGAVAAAMFGGALAWRPTTFVVGDAGTGKSHLNRWLAGIFGRAMHTTKDATGPSIYRLAGFDSLPIAIDELEANKDDNRRVMDVLKLARLAADGAKIYRTAQDGGVSEFTVHGSFFFSAINMPPLFTQDYSRMIVLELRQLSEGATRKSAPNVTNPQIGPMLLRRLMDEWHRFGACFDAYAAALAKGGHASRGQDTFGTALACAHLLLGEEALDALGLPYENLDQWGEWLAPNKVPALASASSNWLQCVRTLMTSRVEVWREGHRKTVTAVLEALEQGGPDGLSIKEARTWLHQAGLGIADKWRAQLGYVLAVPHSSDQVAALLKGSVFGGQGSVGVWAGALRQAPPEVVLRPENPVFEGKRGFDVIKIDGFPHRCSLVSLSGLKKAMEGGA
jgi:hypothetical protein